MMATQQAHAGALTDLPGVMSRDAQRRAFRAAKRHTWLVAFLKLALPVLALGIVALYFLPSKIVPTLPDEGRASIKGINLDGGGLKMINPHYTGNNKKIGRYSIGADYALQQITSPHILEMHKIKGSLQDRDNNKTQLQANKGVYDTKTERMDMEGDILITSSRGMEARLQTVHINMKKQLITTKKPVEMGLNGNQIRADAMTLSTARKSVLFKGNVKVKLYRDKPMVKAPLRGAIE